MPSRPQAAFWSAVAVLLLSMSLPTASSQGGAAGNPYPGACREIDPNDAVARGSGQPLRVTVGGNEAVAFDAAAASQEGPGRDSSDAALMAVALPGQEDPIVTAELLTARTDLEVEDDLALEAEAWTTTKVANVNILDGLVTADAVEGWAYARSDVRSARTSNDHTQVVGLKVEGVSLTNVAPGARVPILALFPGSYVAVEEREDHSRFPGGGSILYVADVTVRVLHVHVESPTGDDIDIVVSEAHAYAQTPTPWCGLRQSVEAGAYNVRVRPLSQGKSILLGEQHIPITGGTAYQVYAAENASAGAEVETAWAETRATGEVKTNDESVSRAEEKVGGLCVKLGEDDCFVYAEFIRAESNSKADAEGAVSWGSVTIVDLKVAGVDVCEALGMPDDDAKTSPDGTHPNACKPARNTVLDLGVATVTLNQRQRDPMEPGHTGYYVRAVRVDAPGLGTVIVGRAYTAADYIDLG